MLPLQCEPVVLGEGDTIAWPCSSLGRGGSCWHEGEQQKWQLPFAADWLSKLPIVHPCWLINGEGEEHGEKNTKMASQVAGDFFFSLASAGIK